MATKEFDGTVDVPGASLRPQAPQISRGRGPILIRQGELHGGRKHRKMCGRGLKLSYGGPQGGKGKGCHRGMLGTGKKRGPPGAQDTLSQLRLNNQPVPSNSAEPVAYVGGGRKRR